MYKINWHSTYFIFQFLGYLYLSINYFSSFYSILYNLLRFYHCYFIYSLLMVSIFIFFLIHLFFFSFSSQVCSIQLNIYFFVILTFNICFFHFPSYFLMHLIFFLYLFNLIFFPPALQSFRLNQQSHSFEHHDYLKPLTPPLTE